MFGVEFRPLDFGSVYGLTVVKTILKGVLKTEQYDPGYLFAGSFSSGKTTIGRIFARSILCSNRWEDMSPCNECDSCRAFLEERHPGYLEIDAANNGTKDRVQDIKESLQYESVAGYKIILFDEAHSISKEGKDALLTQLERTNNNVVLIFCTTEIEKMPSTISSRCLEFHFPDPTEEQIVEKLKSICKIKGLTFEDSALHMIVRVGGRHFRDAENKLRQVSLLGDVTDANARQVITNFDREITALLLYVASNVSKAIKVLDFLIARMDVRRLYHNMLAVLNDAIKLMNGVVFLDEHYSALLKKLVNAYDKRLFEIIDYLLTKNKLDSSTFLMADVLVMHYKFVKGGFKTSGFSGSNSEKEKKSEVAPKKKNKRDLLEVDNLEPWEKDEKIRKFKMKNIQGGSDQRVEEKVSEVWGPETKNVSGVLQKSKLSPKEFASIVRGDLEENKV